ncbi:MAG: hypothetical protein NT062_38505 [Proteobacteria bacterium]|nr:hypothetical protein [Pseudomonadota bacterium]
MLQRIGLVGAASIAWACSPRGAPPHRPTPAQQSDEVRGWLRGAVARLASKFPIVHALASTRRRSSAAVDVLGAGVARGRSDGVVIVVRDHDGRWREEVSSDLSAAGITAIVRALGAAGAGPALVGFGRVGHATKLVGVDPRDLSDGQLRARAERMAADPGAMSSRIVYASGLLEIDDTTVWSVTPDHDLEQRLVRVRRSAARVAWNGTRPVVGQVGLGWRGGVDDRALEPADLERAGCWWPRRSGDPRSRRGWRSARSSPTRRSRWSTIPPTPRRTGASRSTTRARRHSRSPCWRVVGSSRGSAIAPRRRRSPAGAGCARATTASWPPARRTSRSRRARRRAASSSMMASSSRVRAR